MGRTYTRSVPVRGLLAEVMADHGMVRVDSGADLIIPDDATRLERYLRELPVEHPRQAIMGISGCDFLVSRSALWEQVRRRHGRAAAASIMPQTCVLRRDDDLDIFIARYRPDRVYVLKDHRQRRQGIRLTRSLVDVLAARHERCNVAQEFIAEPLLVDGLIMRLRLYVVLRACRGSLEGFLHREGLCGYARQPFIAGSTDLESAITATVADADPAAWNRRPADLAQLMEHLAENGSDDRALTGALRSALGMIVAAHEPRLGKLRRLWENLQFQLFGVDVIFDRALRPYVLEFNKGPDMRPAIPAHRGIKKRVLRDLLGLAGMVEDDAAGGFEPLSPAPAPSP